MHVRANQRSEIRWNNAPNDHYVVPHQPRSTLRTFRRYSRARSLHHSTLTPLNKGHKVCPGGRSTLVVGHHASGPQRPCVETWEAAVHGDRRSKCMGPDLGGPRAQPGIREPLEIDLATACLKKWHHYAIRPRALVLPSDTLLSRLLTRIYCRAVYNAEYKGKGRQVVQQEEFLQAVSQLKARGKSIRAIAAELGVNRGRVDRAFKKLALPGTEKLKEGPGGDVFVGRRLELQVLTTALADALSGRGRIVMLSGEPGIGKTAGSGNRNYCCRQLRAPAMGPLLRRPRSALILALGADRP